jgi:hypothetical protein
MALVQKRSKKKKKMRGLLSLRVAMLSVRSNFACASVRFLKRNGFGTKKRSKKKKKCARYYPCASQWFPCARTSLAQACDFSIQLIKVAVRSANKERQNPIKRGGKMRGVPILSHFCFFCARGRRTVHVSYEAKKKK